MSGGDWGLVGLGGSKHGPQSLTFFFFLIFKLVERYTFSSGLMALHIALYILIKIAAL